MNIIDIKDKRFLKKLTRNLNNGISHKDEASSLEIFKAGNSMSYVLLDNNRDLEIVRNACLPIVIQAYNRDVQNFHKQK